LWSENYSHGLAFNLRFIDEASIFLGLIQIWVIITSMKPFSEIKVLVVEDSLATRLTYQKMLNELKVLKVDKVSDGR